MLTALVAVSAMVIATFGLTGCDQGSATEPTTSDELMMLAMPAPTMDASDVEEGTVENDMRLRHPEGDRAHHPLARLFRALQLTDEQKATARELVAAHEDCVSTILERLRASEAEILAPFREERAAIVAKVKAGELTREEARPLLRQLAIDAREALKANPLREDARVALEECRTTFYRSLRAILTEEQAAILDRWINHEGPGRGHGGRGNDDGSEGSDDHPGRGPRRG